MTDDHATGSRHGPDAAEARGRKLARAHDATWALWEVLRTADEAEHAMAKDLGLPYTDAIALDLVLNAVEPFGPGELARRLGITTASVTVLVDRLVASGHLVRSPDPKDGRRRVLHGTERGYREATAAMAPLIRRLDAAAARLDPTTATAVAGYLRDVAAATREFTASPRRQG